MTQLIVFDSFTGSAPGTLLNLHTGQVLATWIKNTSKAGTAQMATGNRVRPTNGTEAIYYASGVPTSADYSVGCYYYVASNDPGSFTGPVVRASPGATNTNYALGYSATTQQWEMFRNVNNAGAGVGTSFPMVLATGQTYFVSISAIGNTISASVNGIQIICGSDASITQTGFAGLTFQGVAGQNDASGYQIAMCVGQNTPYKLVSGVTWAESSPDGNSVTLHYSITAPQTPLTVSGTPAHFLVTAVTSGQPVSITGVTQSAPTDLTFALSRAVYDYECLTLSYTGGDGVIDALGNPITAFNNMTVNNLPVAGGATGIPSGGTNVVALATTPFGDTGSGIYLAKNLFDGSFLTYFQPTGTDPVYVGMDAGQAVILRSIKLTPRSGDGTTNWEDVMQGIQVQGSNTSSVAGYVTLYQTPTSVLGFLPRMWWNTIPLYTSGVPYRYYRIQQPTGAAPCTCIVEFETDAGTMTGARPIAPTISPWGGYYPLGSVQVTITSPTTTAQIYYMTGTGVVTTGSTLYTGPFALTIGATGTVLQTMAFSGTLSSPTSFISSGFFYQSGFYPRQTNYDQFGNIVEGHDAGILTVAGAGSVPTTFYWYSAFANLTNPSGGVGGPDQGKGIWCYSSTDLHNWKMVGQVLDSAGWKWVERPHVKYNALNNNYVLWCHLTSGHNTTDRGGVAISKFPQGPWHFIQTYYNPNNNGYKDCNLFVDTNGSGYTAHTDGAQSKLLIDALTPDFQDTFGPTTTAISSTREAPILFNLPQGYILITSQSNPYNSISTSCNQTYLINSGASPLVAWPAYTNVPTLFASDPNGTNYNGQSSDFVQIPGKISGYLYKSDFWTGPIGLYNSREVWLPLSNPVPTGLILTTPTVWDLSMFAPSYPAGCAF